MRETGILFHISSLPSKYGIGTLGIEAYKFSDFLKESHQQYWQVLPIGPTSYGDSPYQTFSAFAGNPYFIDLDMLKAVEELVSIPVIASGGAGCIEDFVTLFRKIPTIAAGLAASIFHFGEVKIHDLKEELQRNNINVRL